MMGPWHIRSAIALAALLTAIIVAELSLVDVGGKVPALPAADPAAPQNAQPFSPTDAAQTILSRPLFLPGRRPRGGEVARPEDDHLPRLTGIVISHGRKLAVFQPDGEKARTLTEGDIIGTWTIQKIDHRQVMMQKSGGVMTIVPAKDVSNSGTPGDASQQGNPFSDAGRRQPGPIPPGPVPPGMAVRP